MLVNQIAPGLVIRLRANRNQMEERLPDHLMSYPGPQLVFRCAQGARNSWFVCKQVMLVSKDTVSSSVRDQIG